MRILTLETTCDETAAAVVTDRSRCSSSVVASQEQLHERFGGVVPEIASRAHVERILPVIDETLRKAGLTLGRSRRRRRGQHAGPGGLAAGRARGGQGAVRWRSACRWWRSTICRPTSTPAGSASGRDVFPCVGLIVSGGHTNLYRCAAPIDFKPLGGTIDDAAGEAFDKVASLLGLPFPGGPAISKAAAQAIPKNPLSRARCSTMTRLDFSFSGLKTAVRYK